MKLPSGELLRGAWSPHGELKPMTGLQRSIPGDGGYRAVDKEPPRGEGGGEEVREKEG